MALSPITAYNLEQPPLTRGLSFLHSKNDWGRDNATFGLYFYPSLPPSRLRRATSLVRGRCSNACAVSRLQQKTSLCVMHRLFFVGV